MKRRVSRAPPGGRLVPGRGLFRKYLLLFLSVVCVAVVSNALLDLHFSLRDHRALLAANQRLQAEVAAGRIRQFVGDIVGSLSWATQLSRTESTLEDWQFSTAHLFRRVPAIAELVRLDGAGREQLLVSRVAPTVIDSRNDLSRDPRFVGALASKVHYGPVYFLRETEPYMAISVADAESGVTIVEVNLGFVRDVLSQIKVGEHGRAYVVDSHGHLIAHPDISLALRNLDLSLVEPVRRALTPEPAPPEPRQPSWNAAGEEVLTAHAPVVPPGWHLLIELPIAEADAPLHAAIERSIALLVGVLLVGGVASLLITGRMMAPIEALHDGVARIGSGDLGRRIVIETGDELQALGEQINSMASRLEESHSSLERKVEERTHQLELANLAKSRFLAAASHDLRQPLHALGLFVAELPAHVRSVEGRRIIGRIDAAVSAMNEMFMALLDTSRLDAGTYRPDLSDFPIQSLLGRLTLTFTAVAEEKGLSLRIAPSTAWVRSDAVLVERILLNLVSNALRYTERGGVVVGCRRRGRDLRIEVWDSGPGIPEDERTRIFGEFYQSAVPKGGRRVGLGLGLSIVGRLCAILDHPIELTSIVGKGSRFAIVVPMLAEPPAAAEAVAPPAEIGIDAGQLVVIVEDDPLVLEGMRGLLLSWGLRVLACRDEGEAVAGICRLAQPPDLIISDYQLADGATGIDVIGALRRSCGARVPAFLVSGDISAELLQRAGSSGLHLLHKPVSPMKLRALVSRLLHHPEAAVPAVSTVAVPTVL